MLFVLILWGSKRTRDSFARRDLGSLWELSEDDAQRFMRPPGGYPPVQVRR